MLNLGYLGGVYKQQWKTSLTNAVVKTENCETYSKCCHGTVESLSI